ncbi:hypothetical protein [Mycobacterium avium]|uniref:hypothetical protein n=1 Tax=Mycobacterium avium TaxID=1764 RepID=UPI0007A02921|nr:hypothetical protein [Mycobacterium avium]MBZ4508579.1 hypothetical protein [Mycobacterium avium subsp. hominissuis]MBZ4516308.1 hypothetical protein [Mycobacterium avium subsp. hominissuis]MBZ4545847.1 hypothetical protein [Mycobacterium avium subsp. hominissuis]MBZ4554333.1 hypothetical protein [Mycobacterium avium subsp. hominissuis]MBZ4564218.1 hypothetical protein [Mycobacterium avium subsp. hominissuis]
MSTTTQRGRPPSTETRIRRQYAELLEEIGGGRIDFSPDELAMIDFAVRIGQRIDLLAAALAAEAGKPNPDPAALVRISAEMRASEKESMLTSGRVRRGLEKTLAVADKPVTAVRVAGHNGGRR